MVTTLIIYAVSAVLVGIMVMEAKNGKIPNLLIGVLILLFVPLAYLGDINVLRQVGIAFAVLISGYALFAFGAFGAGAVKLSAAVTLFLPFDALDVLGIFLVTAVIFALILFGTLRSMFGHGNQTWYVLANRVVPMSVPIGVTTICGLFLV